MPKAKRAMPSKNKQDQEAFLPMLKRILIAKTSRENLYFKQLADHEQTEVARRHAKVKRHKIDALLPCPKCGSKNVKFQDKVARSADEGSLTEAFCQNPDCGKTIRLG
jgi:DNA-directed RNA polymerase subunit M/transcription elongation factor TFIIS